MGLFLKGKFRLPRDLAGRMPWWSMKQSTGSSEQIKPDKNTERLRKSKTVTQVKRNEDMEQKSCRGSWEIGNQAELEG